MPERELRRRVPERTQEAESVDDKLDEAGAPSSALIEGARLWHEYTSVRIVLTVLGIFAVMHLFLWKIVYDFAMAENHECAACPAALTDIPCFRSHQPPCVRACSRLRDSVSTARTMLRGVLDHL